MEDDDAAAQPFVDFDAGAGVAGSGVVGEHLERGAVEVEVLSLDTVRRYLKQMTVSRQTPGGSGR